MMDDYELADRLLRRLATEPNRDNLNLKFLGEECGSDGYPQTLRVVRMLRDEKLIHTHEPAHECQYLGGIGSQGIRRVNLAGEGGSPMAIHEARNRAGSSEVHINGPITGSNVSVSSPGASQTLQDRTASNPPRPAPPPNPPDWDYEDRRELEDDMDGYLRIP